MPEFITRLEREPDQHPDKDDAALEAMLEAFDPSRPEETQVPEPPAEEAPVEEAAPPVEEVPQVEPEPEPDAEAELAASLAEREKIKAEKLEAALAALQAHSSRQAGEIGFLRQKLESIPRTSEPYEPQSEAEVDRLTKLERTLESERTARIEAQVSQAISEEVARLDGPWAQEYASELQVVVPKYSEEIARARQTEDPKLARQLTAAVLMQIKADVREIKWEATHKRLEEKKATTAPKRAKDKQAAAVSGSGTIPAPIPQPKSFADMTADEADAWLRENVR